jgi:hypothetical protein
MEATCKCAIWSEYLACLNKHMLACSFPIGSQCNLSNMFYSCSQCAKMVSECAVALACDAEECPKSYGVITPSIAFGQRLVDRLGKRGLAISVTSDAPTK